MARFVKLWRERRDVVSALVTATREADEAREREYLAAVIIQSWFRGCRLRAYLGYLSECATIIQSRYRGHLDRKYYRQLLKNLVVEMEEHHYNSMATTIQKRWRGYYVRRYVFDYYAQKRYLTELKRKNEIMGQRLAEERRRREMAEAQRNRTLQELQLEADLRRQHHMLSTKCREGVYRPFKGGRSQPLPIETRMMSLKFYTPSKSKSNKRTLSCDSHMTSLPPITLPNKIQGPFQSPGMVWRQRHRALDPTLRVSTPYDCQETAREELKAREWRERIVEEPFLPFSTTSRCYQPLLHTTSSFTRLGYGTRHFREEDTSKHIHHQGFQTVIPPIPVFDKHNNNTYS